jgi:hypothetical protein
MSHREMPGGTSRDGTYYDFSLMNLLDVALKYLKAVTVKLVIGEVERKHLRLDLAQTGVGIEVMRRLKRIKEIVHQQRDVGLCLVMSLDE